MASSLPDILEGSPVRGSNIQDLMHGLSSPVRCQTPKAMKSPGAMIPTPMGAYRQKTPSPEKIVREYDDSAFLPDDFTRPTFQEKENAQFTAKQLQDKIDEAVRKAQKEWTATVRKQLELENRITIDDMRRAGEQTLEEHTRSWEEDHLDELTQVKKEMAQQQEQKQTQFEQQTLGMKEHHQTQVEELQSKLALTKQEAERSEADLRAKLAELEKCSNIMLDKHCEQVEENKKSHLESMQRLRQEYEQKLQYQEERIRDAEINCSEQLDHSTKTSQQQCEHHERTMAELQKTLTSERMTSQTRQDETISEYKSQIVILKEDTESKLRVLREELTAKHDTEVCVLTRELDSLVESKQRIEHLESTNLSLLQQIEAASTAVASEKTASIELMATAKEDHLAQIEELRKEFAVERTLLADRGSYSRLEAAEQMKELTTKVVTLEKLVEEGETMKKWWEDKLNKERTDFSKAETELIASHKREIEEMSDAFKKRMEKEQQGFQERLDATLAIQQDRSKQEAQHADHMEDALKMEREKYDEKLKEVEKAHNAQIAEILAELDKIEVENNQHSTALEKAMEQKDAIISALGTQLADATHKKSELEVEQEAYSQQLSATEAQLNLSLAEIAELEQSLAKMETQGKMALDEEKRRSQKASDQIRNETIAAAKEQFSKANGHYMTLKHEYDNSVMKTASLEKEVRSIKRDVERVQSEAASRDAEVESELAQSKAGEWFSC